MIENLQQGCISFKDLVLHKTYAKYYELDFKIAGIDV